MVRQHFRFEKGFVENIYETLPRGRDSGDDIRCHPWSFQRKPTGTRGPNTREYGVLLVLVTGISKPGNTREYPGNWQKGNTSTAWPRCTGFIHF